VLIGTTLPSHAEDVKWMAVEMQQVRESDGGLRSRKGEGSKLISNDVIAAGILRTPIRGLESIHAIPGRIRLRIARVTSNRALAADLERQLSAIPMRLMSLERSLLLGSTIQE
jgi:hypothetical protein